MIVIREIFVKEETVKMVVREAKASKKVMDRLARVVGMYGAISETIEFRGSALQGKIQKQAEKMSIFKNAIF